MADDDARSGRVQLSVTQVLAGAVAAMVGSLAASRLGVAGTIAGAAVISVVATVLTAINVNSVVSVRERARNARLTAARGRVEARHANDPLAREAADAADLAEISELETEERAEADGGGRFTVADRKGYHWSVIAGVSALVFVLAMVGITVVEKFTGQAIACSFGRDCDDQTTIPLPGRPKPTPSPTPTVSPSATPTPGESPSATPTQAPSDTPSPSPSDTIPPSSTPVPSTSVGASPASS